MFDNTTNSILQAFKQDSAEVTMDTVGLARMYLDVLEGGPDEAALDPETAGIITAATMPENYTEALRIRALENEAIRALREVAK